ncbi:hypothetical protein HNP86_001935 [Methanococcus maripaludis]|uniref:Uncharacterized protein n=1 Tax=Methanococcus maripaludis TaxID=39152 RepID=A0A7J9P169_METMI|nr:hypothetical protein [Methanococcus maripaludis]MBA2851776.1 hypothetical protein [Methanococcus maripaludis]
MVGKTIFEKIEYINGVSREDSLAVGKLASMWSDAISYIDITETDVFKARFGNSEFYNVYLRTMYAKLNELGIPVTIFDRDIQTYLDSCMLARCDTSNANFSENIDGFDGLKESIVKVIGVYSTDDSVNMFLSSPLAKIPRWIVMALRNKYETPDKQFHMYSAKLPDDMPYIESYDLALVKRIPDAVREAEFSKGIKVIKPHTKFVQTEDVKVEDLGYTYFTVQPKMNGMKAIVRNNRVYSDDLNVLDIKPETLIAKKLPDDVYIVGEIWSKTLPRNEVVGLIKRGEFTEDMLFTAFDYVNLKVDEPYYIRFRHLTDLNIPVAKTLTTVNAEKPYSCNLIKLLDFVNEPCYDGIVIRDMSSSYDDPKQMVAIKKSADVDVRVKFISKTKNDSYVYDISTDDDGTEIVIGKTFATKLKFNVGDIIEVVALETNLYDDKLTLYGVNVADISTNKKPDTKDDIINAAKKAGTLNEM